MKMRDPSHSNLSKPFEFLQVSDQCSSFSKKEGHLPLSTFLFNIWHNTPQTCILAFVLRWRNHIFLITNIFEKSHILMSFLKCSNHNGTQYFRYSHTTDRYKCIATLSAVFSIPSQMDSSLDFTFLLLLCRITVHWVDIFIVPKIFFSIRYRQLRSY